MFSSLYRHTMLRKLGLHGHRDSAADDDDLLTTLGQLLVDTGADYALFFRKAAVELTFEGDTYLVIPQSAILALVRDSDVED